MMLENITAYYKLNQKIKDEKFNIDLIPRYNLSLQVSHILFRICITDTEDNRCLLIEDYQLNSVKDHNELLEVLKDIYDNHHLLNAGFWKSIKLGIKNMNFSLIPHSLFDQEYLADYLSINCKKELLSKENLYYYKQNSTDAVNIFSADKQIIKFFTEAYPLKKIQVVHHTSPFIEGVLIGGNGNKEKKLHILVENNFMTILVNSSKKMEFCNCFNFTSTEDFVYFVMFVFDQLNLNPETTEVTLFGEIATDSSIYLKLSKYIANLSFGNKPSNLYFGYQFDEVFDHRFFDLYNMHLCE
ncbi:MAG: DUF3822 family protein [Cytophagaceae bacterium]